MPQDPAIFQDELAQRDAEIVRLRGLLVERDAELGTALGRLAALEAHLQQLLGLAHRLQRIPGAARLAKAVLRGLRRLRGRPRG
ncbi:MAG TPA: hypothetical protein VFI03_05205 [Solirubrobacterales bacterium]|nr:hypothetical protein [Solirubrobacterales bacterium]